MSASGAPEPADTPPRRSAQRILGGVALILVAAGLLYTGIDAIVDPGAVVAGSSRSARSPDTDAEAKIGGLLLCFFGLTVLGFGIGLLTSKTSVSAALGSRTDRARSGHQD
ncbi:hypothetical protein [Nocardia neocaledoniensis]|uniref:hypothetical protein n=1 Tax=Nocardia neocaledoniensis TaxID=236511 RepID=UPI00245691EA|nr:hypothetical protein [Nocardia neocaledoniensis]